jgi:hypothetical protein|nr:MAG TPA: hypothetical protein [Caudoviricetes sp.]
MDAVEKLRVILREKDVPFFTDDELIMQLERAGNDIDIAAYHCLIIKAEECSLNVSGLSIADSHTYWLRLASMYRPNCTTIRKGG